MEQSKIIYILDDEAAKTAKESQRQSVRGLVLQTRDQYRLALAEFMYGPSVRHLVQSDHTTFSMLGSKLTRYYEHIDN